jgi:uncharacterized protein DUF3105
MATKNAGKVGSRRPVSGAARRQRLWASGLGIAVLAAALVGYLAYRAAADLPGVKLADLGNAHIQMATDPHLPYNSAPPTSGPHLPYIAPWGIHTQPIVNELQVHNLEDGGVMVQYHCSAPCPELVAKLTEVVKRYETQVILAPYPGMRTRIALTAWTRLDAFDDFDEARIVRFIRAYRGIDHHKG